MPPRPKLKAASSGYTPQTRSDVVRDIKTIGDLQREYTRIEADISDQLAALTKAAAPRIEQLRERIGTLQAGVQTWCEAHRVEICGKGKTANLITGEVAWRQRPPSVSVRNADSVIGTLLEHGLAWAVRQKTEVNKEAILADPSAVAGIKGLTVVTGLEDFVITPFEADLGDAT